MLVVTPNLCFDVTVRLPALVPGAVLRATDTTTSAGGKGVNVVRSSRATGTAGTRLVGFVPRTDGDRLAQLLQREGTELLGADADGEVRVATIFLEQDGRTTVINGRGPQITAEQWQALVDTVAAALQPGEVLVCSGSLPPGVATDGYGQLVALAHAHGCRAVVDAAPAPLAAALSHRPDLISPNLSEAEGLLDGTTSEQVDETGDDIPARAVRAAVELHRRGAVRAVVTAGSSGAALATDDGSWWFTSPRAVVVSPIGAGDSFVGGAGPLLQSRDSIDDVALVVRGMATASASCEQELAGGVDPARVTELAAQITVSARRPSEALR